MGTSILLFEHPRRAAESHYNDVANAPLSACLMSGYAAAVLRDNGCDADIYDAYLTETSLEECARELIRRPWDILGVHAVYFWEHTPELFALLERVRRMRPGGLVLLYGFFPTQACRDILLQHRCVDGIIIGEPELVLLNAARRPVLPQAGIACRDGGDVRSAVPHTVADLDRLPQPVRSARSLSVLGGLVLGSRGCYGACSFCCINAFYGSGSGWRGRAPANIAAEIEAQLPQLARRYVYFLDANFFARGAAGQERAAAIARHLGGMGLEFGLECRSNDVVDDTIALLVTAGLRDVFLGIESADNGSLRRMRKGISPGSSARAVAILRDHGIEPSLGFIMFEPDGTLGDVRRNFEFLRAHGLLRRLATTANVLYHQEIMLRGTPRFAQFERAGRLRSTGCYGYEGRYAWIDPAAEALADVMAQVCRRVLHGMGTRGSPIFLDREDGRPAGRINEYLVDLFATLLGRLQADGAALEGDARLRVVDEALHAIEGFLGEARVCQP
jgi:radical SAM superfamily enzyme YgiQ (UPF0313 family)